MEIANFSHTGNIGDVISAIPAMRQFHIKTGKYIRLYLVRDVHGVYYDGATHPTKDNSGKNVMLNQKMIDMLTPLLLAQEYICEVVSITEEEYKETDILCHLEWIRETNVGMPSLSINRWYFYVFPDLAFDLSKKWLNVPDSDIDLAKEKIIITRTERYTNHNINYSFLKPIEDDLIFSGTMREYNIFCMTYDLNIKKLTVDNFLTLAQAIKQSRFHVTNQTMANQISTGLFHPSILETCTFAPNCIPVGEDRYDFLAQEGLNYYFDFLYQKTK